VQVLALVPRADVAARALFARWLVAFCRASKWYIREDEPLEEELRGWLEPSELQQLVRALLLLLLLLRITFERDLLCVQLVLC
jgi:predicted membrane chloride channel (bestrophin family)